MTSPMSDAGSDFEAAKDFAATARGKIRRSEFIGVCQSLLADSPGYGGGTNHQDLHALFDVLDPQGTGIGDMEDFMALLHAGPQPERYKDNVRKTPSQQDVLKQASESLQRSGASLRHDLLASSWPDSMPQWITRNRAVRLLAPHLPEDELDALLHAVTEVSNMYQGPPQMAKQHKELIRAETLLACTDRWEEHTLLINIISLQGPGSNFQAGANKRGQTEVFLRCKFHGVECASQTRSLVFDTRCSSPVCVSARFDLAVKFVLGLNSNDRLDPIFEKAGDLLSIEVWCQDDDKEKLMSSGSLSSVEFSAFLASPEFEWQTQLQLHDQSPQKQLAKLPKVRLLSSSESCVAQASWGSLRIKISSSKREPDSPSLPLPWHASFHGGSICQHDEIALSSPLKPVDENESVLSSAVIEVCLGSLALRSALLSKLVTTWLADAAPPGFNRAEPKCSLLVSLRVISGVGGYADHGAMPVRSLAQAIPMVPAAHQDLLHFNIGLSWRGSGPDGVRSIRGAVLELWLRAEWAEKAILTDAPVMELRAAERFVPLTEYLSEISGQVRLSVPFELESASWAELDLSCTVRSQHVQDEPRNPKGHMLAAAANPDTQPRSIALAAHMSDVSTSRQKSMTGVKAGIHVDHRVCICELWLATGPDEAAQDEAEPYYYVEVATRVASGRQATGQPLPHLRLVPTRVVHAEELWLKLTFQEEEEELLVPSSSVGNEHVTVDLHLFVLGRSCVLGREVRKGTKFLEIAVASLELPLPHDAASQVHLATRRWLQLYSPSGLQDDSICSSGPVGRALIGVETCCPGVVRKQRRNGLLRMQVPAGIELPICDPHCDLPRLPDGPVEKSFIPEALRVAVGEALFAQLTDDKLQDNPLEGWVSLETFNICLESHGYGSDSEFFQNEVSSLFCKRGQLIPYVPLLCWLAIRAIARLLCSTGLRSIWQMFSELDDSGYGSVPVASLRAMRASSSVLAGLPSGLWDFLECWHSWTSRADGQLSVGQHFDYIAFFSDLRSSGIDVLEDPSVLWIKETGNVSPEYKHVSPRRHNRTDAFTVVLQIKRALHLPLFGSKCPSTCVAFGWRVAGNTSDGRATESWSSGELGRTDVIYRTTCPAWDFSMPLMLPLTIGDCRFVSYPSGFQKLELYVQVFHIEIPAGSNSSNNRGTLLGTASVPLAPLLTGFQELDGYFHINTTNESSRFGQGTSGHGQIYLKLVPNSGAFCEESTLNTHMSLSHKPCHPTYDSDSRACHPTYDSDSKEMEPSVLRPEPLQESPSDSRGANLLCAPRSALPVMHPATSGETETNETLCNANEGDDSYAEQVHVAMAIEQLPDFLDIFGSQPAPILDGNQEDSSTDVVKMSEIELRINSRLSSIELALSTSKDTEEQQLHTIRQCHQRNMAELEEMQHRLLCLSWEDARTKDARSVQLSQQASEKHETVNNQSAESCAAEELPVESITAPEAPLGVSTGLSGQLETNVNSEELPVENTAAPEAALRVSADKDVVAPPCAVTALAGDVAGGHVAGDMNARMPATSSASASATSSATKFQLQASGGRPPGALHSHVGSVQSSLIQKSDRSSSSASRAHAKAASATYNAAEVGLAEIPSFASEGVANKVSQARHPRAHVPYTHFDCATSEDAPVSAGSHQVIAKAVETRDTAAGTSPIHQVRADAAIQTEFVSSLTKLRESPGVLRLARRCQKGSPATASTTADTTSDLIETPRTHAGSESISMATTAATPNEERPLQRIRGRPVKGDARLDAETQRIARIMRGGSLAARFGNCGLGEDSDGSSSSEGE